MGVKISQLPQATAPTDYLDGSEFMMNGADGSTMSANLGDLKSSFFCNIRCASVTISTVDVLQLNSVPIEIVAAVSGKAIEILSASLKMAYNSVAYATNTNITLTATGASEDQYEFGSIPLSSASDVFAGTQGNDDTIDSIIENASITVSVAIGNPTLGNSDIEVFVLYRLI